MKAFDIFYLHFYIFNYFLLLHISHSYHMSPNGKYSWPRTLITYRDISRYYYHVNKYRRMPRDAYAEGRSFPPMIRKSRSRSCRVGHILPFTLARVEIYRDIMPN